MSAKMGVKAVRERLTALAGQMQRGEISLEMASDIIRTLTPHLERSGPGPMNPGRRAEERRV